MLVKYSSVAMSINISIRAIRTSRRNLGLELGM